MNQLRKTALTYARKNINRVKKITKKKKKPHWLIGFSATFFLLSFCALILFFSVRGHMGNPTVHDLNSPFWKDNGPLELSPERGRYAELYALVENHSFHFSSDLARFVAPDVAYTNGHYVSLFPPGVSLIVSVGYFIGRQFDMAQVGSFLVISLFAVINVFLIRSISISLGVDRTAATIASLVFLFATPAFSYASTLYQHHITTCIILFSMFALLRFRSWMALLIVWFLSVVAVMVDFPNFFLMLPVSVYALTQLIAFHSTKTQIRVNVSLAKMLTLLIIILPLGVFLWFNQMAYGNPLQIAGTIERAIQVKPNGQPVLEHTIMQQQSHTTQTFDKSNVANFFQTRAMLYGAYILFLSPDRGIIMYTPIMLLGFIGLIYAIKKNMRMIAVITGIMGFTFLLYAMWGDPYGGWAFGSRYLIPAYAMLSILIGVLLTQWRKQIIFLFFFFILFSYSVSVNTLGAITSNSNPPKIEADALTKQSGQEQKYTYARNIDFLLTKGSKSFFYQTFAGYLISPVQYYLLLDVCIILVGGGTMVVLYTFSLRKEVEYDEA